MVSKFKGGVKAGERVHEHPDVQSAIQVNTSWSHGAYIDYDPLAGAQLGVWSLAFHVTELTI